MLPKSGVTVRMYDVGFGDCFLLAFRAEDDTARYMLIDCGAHQGYTGGAARLRKIAADIADVTENHLDVVVVTHEHWDHLAGFCRARAFFDSPMQIDELWLAWPENDQDEDTQHLKDLYGKSVAALAAAAQGLQGVEGPLAGRLAGILAFDRKQLAFDQEGFDAGLAEDQLLPAADNTNEAQYRFLREHSKKAPPPYLQPSDPPRVLPGVNGIRFYVLGPPRELESLRETELTDEPHLGLSLLDEHSAFLLAMLAARGEDELDDEVKEAYWRSLPFERRSPYRIPLDALKSGKAEKYRRFFEDHYGLDGEAEQDSAWRRIDTDWLHGALEVALKISEYVNNTSLVLALELTGSEPHKVLLFAADAQIGNWRSWNELTWFGDCGDPEVTGSDLIMRTVLYKVGHHGSQNATLTEWVEKMSPDLVAMIPVDEDWALAAQGWQHPAESVLRALEKRTKGRILRADQIPPGDEPPPRPADATAAEWQAFVEHLDWDRGPDRLWIQYTVPG
jgi:hypothetical protein